MTFVSAIKSVVKTNKHNWRDWTVWMTHLTSHIVRLFATWSKPDLGISAENQLSIVIMTFIRHICTALYLFQLPDDSCIVVTPRYGYFGDELARKKKNVNESQVTIGGHYSINPTPKSDLLCCSEKEREPAKHYFIVTIPARADLILTPE